jgi:hypothetical protein
MKTNTESKTVQSLPDGTVYWLPKYEEYLDWNNNIKDIEKFLIKHVKGEDHFFDKKYRLFNPFFSKKECKENLLLSMLNYAESIKKEAHAITNDLYKYHEKTMLKFIDNEMKQ